MFDQVPVEVETIRQVIFCWRRETSPNRWCQQQIQLLFEFSFDQFHHANILPDFDAIFGGQIELIGGLHVEEAVPVVEEACDAVDAVVGC